MRRDYYSQRSDRLAVTQLTVHSPASRPANRTAAECAVPVLTSAPPIGVAHTRYTSVRPTADRVGRNLHRSLRSDACRHLYTDNRHICARPELSTTDAR